MIQEEEEKQAFELQSTKEGLESIVAGLDAQNVASAQMAKALKQQAMLYTKSDPLHAVLSQLAQDANDQQSSAQLLQSSISAQVSAYQEFLQVTRKEYLEKKGEYESKQTKLQRSKHETPELQQAVDDALQDFQTYSSQVYKVHLDALSKSNVLLFLLIIFVGALVGRFSIIRKRK